MSQRRLLGVMLVSMFVFATGAEAKKKPEKPVDINTATVEELVQLPGVGKEIAGRIVRHREVSGRFRRVEELLVIRGISRKKLEAMRRHLKVMAEKKAGSSLPVRPTRPETQRGFR
ncbi:MAG: ComEA family DNA-binding protein [Terriglobia bacterium]